MAKPLVSLSNIAAVKHIDRIDALALLQNKLGQQGSSKDMVRLAEALGYMPFTMV